MKNTTDSPRALSASDLFALWCGVAASCKIKYWDNDTKPATLFDLFKLEIREGEEGWAARLIQRNPNHGQILDGYEEEWLDEYSDEKPKRTTSQAVIACLKRNSKNLIRWAQSSDDIRAGRSLGRCARQMRANKVITDSQDI